MANYLIDDTLLILIADAIRNKTGSTDKINPADMANKISSIVTGGGGMENVATASEMDAKLTSTNLGKMYRYTGTTTDKYTSGDIYIVEEG